MDDGLRAYDPDAAPVRSAATLSRWWLTALDGTRAWGSIDIWPKRYGFRKYRLVVFPPGIDATDRRYLRLTRSWPTWGAALWLILAIGLSGHGWATSIYPTAVVVVSGAVIFTLTRGTHSRTRTLVAALIDGSDDPVAAARYHQLERLTHTLVTADAMRARGELTTVEHEAVWWSVYETIDESGSRHV